MSLLKLPEIKASAISRVQFDARPDALERWEPAIRAASSEDATISVYDTIGWSWEGEGVTAKRISAALRAIGGRDVTVNINSPGGDFFEGVAIYNLLRAHPHKVTVQVMGLAASAASVIAMAGDEILMGDGAFLMIHNAWAIAVGNRHDMVAASEQLAPFDAAMAEVYAARSGMTSAQTAALMDKETWINASQAVEDGFATGLMESSQITHETNAQGHKKYLALVEASMAKAGHSRSTRRDVLKNLFSGTPSAAGDSAMPSAGADIAASLQTLLSTVQGTV
ncbi:head maturation protease, ClpP-related [Alcaligenes phenolicus]|uniref:head maturation protease, ClpP-related n=1 Tax=Alcaligenes phenolicus TaxID=232846 RepID=UPI002C08D6EF|nr:head maturation protease, ClpP-related [Alcaligenes phenolicus]HRO20826.1 Clp protease ClpP [Alcaligenes phenolicus]HRP13658.1 Clp protease ClpP [Alcaligenes phenolicus]